MEDKRRTSLSVVFCWRSMALGQKVSCYRLEHGSIHASDIGLIDPFSCFLDYISCGKLNTHVTPPLADPGIPGGVTWGPDSL